MKRAALYARVSTAEQTPENQLTVLHAFAAARGWTATDHVDHGVSGAKERRPALDALLIAGGIMTAFWGGLMWWARRHSSAAFPPMP